MTVKPCNTPAGYGLLMENCVRNRTKNYQNLIIAFQVTVENVGDAYLRLLY